MKDTQVADAIMLARDMGCLHKKGVVSLLKERPSEANIANSKETEVRKRACAKCLTPDDMKEECWATADNGCAYVDEEFARDRAGKPHDDTPWLLSGLLEDLVGDGR